LPEFGCNEVEVVIDNLKCYISQYRDQFSRGLILVG